MHLGALPGALATRADVLERTEWPSPGSPGEIGTCAPADVAHLPVSRPDGTLSHPRCGWGQTPQRPLLEVSLQPAFESHTFLGRMFLYCNPPQLIVLRIQPFDGFIVPKFTPGPNNFRAGRECKAGRVLQANGPGSRQEITIHKSAGTRLVAEGFHVWGGGGGGPCNLRTRAKWIKVAPHLPGLLGAPALAAREMVGP